MLSSWLILHAAKIYLLSLFMPAGKIYPPNVIIAMNSTIAQYNVKRHSVISVYVFIVLNLVMFGLNILTKLFWENVKKAYPTSSISIYDVSSGRLILIPLAQLRLRLILLL